jgi:hypothetical protein
MLVITARLPAERTTMVAVDVDVSAGTSPSARHPAAARRADALWHLGEQFLSLERQDDDKVLFLRPELARRAIGSRSCGTWLAAE